MQYNNLGWQYTLWVRKENNNYETIKDTSASFPILVNLIPTGGAAAPPNP